MRCNLSLALLLLPLAIPRFTIGEEKPKFRQSQNYQLQGPIHTQLNITKKLHEDPTGEHKLSIRTQEGWLEFDASGDLVERAHVDASGQPLTTVREKHDAQGQTIESTIAEKEKTLHYRTERETLPFGRTETRTFLDGKLEARFLGSYDAKSGEAESTAFDQNDEITSHVVSHRSRTAEETESWGKNGKFVLHVLYRYDDRGTLIESVRYDAEGRVVSDFSFKDGVLSSWWQDPKCDCFNVAAFRRPDDVTVFYKTTNDGKLLKNVQRHKGRRTNHEIDDDELYDENDRLLEHIAYSYERDQYGNWTRRFASVLDLRTGDMVPVTEDTRKLTYF